MRKFIMMAALIAAILTLSGCSMTRMDELYCLPKRSEEQTDLQAVMDEAMAGKEYSAPVSGDNRQTVQTADLNGDGKNEYILFAKDTSENPLHIFIFSQVRNEYRLIDTIQTSGSAFDQVEYVQMDGNPGYELVVGHQVSDQVLRTVSVYSIINQEAQQMMTSGYSKFLCTDLTQNGLKELFILRSGESDGENGVAELYSLDGGTVERFTEAVMSRPADHIKRVMVSKLNDGVPAVYVASEVNSSAIITDVYALVNGQFSNVSVSVESGTSIQTLRNYYVYAEDIDGDGVLELPSLVEIGETPANSDILSHHVIRWFALQSDGKMIDKLYTYHNHAGGWYLELNSLLATSVTVQQLGNTYQFYFWKDNFTASEKLLSIVVLTGQKREEQAVANNRFVLYRTDTTVYAAKLDVASAAFGIDQEMLTESFHMIVQDWSNTES